MSLLKNFWVQLKSIPFRFRERVARKKIRDFHAHDEKLVQNLSAKKFFPSGKQLNFISAYLNKIELLIIRVLCGIAIIAFISLLINIYWTHSTLVAADGGSYTEGLVGSPRYINPLFAQGNDVDLDLTALTYSGLLKFSNAGMAKDLTESYEISPDQKTYTFKLKNNVLWHDGEKLTADDVIFTFDKINDPKTKTSLYFNFRGATIEKIDNLTIKFTLTEPFAPFLESLTVGILPIHVWQNIQPENMLLAEYNLKPIGSGPYQFKSLVKNKNGSIKAFNLIRNDNYYGAKPHIDDITFKFNASFEQAVEALNNKNIEGISYLPKEIRARIINNRNLNFHLLQLPQYSAVFFNYSDNPVLKDLKIRKILSHAINKEKIVNEILNAEAQIIDSCILPGSLGYNPNIVKYPYSPEYAKAELEKAGWVLSDYNQSKNEGENKKEGEHSASPKDEYQYQVRKISPKKDKAQYLEFTLTTVNQSENVKIAKELQKEWQQIGAKVNLNFVDPNKMSETIKNRSYEALLYGQILGEDPDPYPFWHSSQRTYPGLNLTSFNNQDIDKLIDEARKTADDQKRAEKYVVFQKILADTVPAIFLFNPTYTYPQNKKIKGFNIEKIINPSNRFNQVNEWYINTEREWGKTN